MQRDEVERATVEELDGVKVVTIKVSRHKTGLSERAGVGVTGPVLEHLQQWLEMVKQLHPSSPLVFPNWKGEEVTQLTRAVQMCAATLNIDLPTTQEIRPNVEIRAVGLGEREKHLVARHLSHGTTTAEKSYRALQGTQRAQAFNVVGEVMGIEKPGPSSGPNDDKKKRKKFTAAEEELIGEYFSTHIEARNAPRMSEVTDFLQNHSIEGRSAKDIYDKVRNMYKYK